MVANPRRRTSRPSPVSWTAFERNLATAIGALVKGEFLVLDVKGTGRYVQVASRPPGLRAEAVSNAWLSRRDRLDARRVAALGAMGWSPPTEEPRGEHVEGGSPNHFRDFPAPVSAKDVAHLLVETLSGPFRARGPGSLAYRAFAAKGGEVQLPGLGLRRRASVSRGDRPILPRPESPQARLARAVLAELRRGTGAKDISFGADGNAVVEKDGVACSVRVLSDTTFGVEVLAVRVYAPLGVDITRGSHLVGAVHEVNELLELSRIVVADGKTFLALDIPAEPWVPEHLRVAIETVARYAPAMTATLQARRPEMARY